MPKFCEICNNLVICDNAGKLYINGNLEYTQYWSAWSTQHSFNPSAGCLL